MLRSRILPLLLTVILCTQASTASAAILGQRENGGYAGTGTPLTIFTNPAGMLLSNVTAGIVNVVMMLRPQVLTINPAPRPGDTDPNEEGGRTLRFPFVGTFAVSTRFASANGKKPMPLSLGLGFNQSFGGTIMYDSDTVRAGITYADIRVWELVPAVAYQVNSKLAIGAALRVGFGRWGARNNERGIDSVGNAVAPYDMSATGITVGAYLGLTFKPVPWLRIGASYGTPMNMTYSGTGSIEVSPGQERDDRVETRYPFPQWAALGISFQLAKRIALSANVRWMDWSSFSARRVVFTAAADNTTDWNYHDGIAASLGLTTFFFPKGFFPFGVNLNLNYDRNVIPDTTMKRFEFDLDKLGATITLILALSRNILLITGFATKVGLERTIEDVVKKELNPRTGLVEDVSVNATPGRYNYLVLAMNFGVMFRY